MILLSNEFSLRNICEVECVRELIIMEGTNEYYEILKCEFDMDPKIY